MALKGDSLKRNTKKKPSLKSDCQLMNKEIDSQVVNSYNTH